MNGNNSKIFTKKHPVQVFIVSTGRSGTTTLAKILDGIDGCSVKHELEPKLLQEVILYITGKMSLKEITNLIRDTRNTEKIGGRILSGEANQRLSFVLPALAEAFPEANYIWLIRDGRKVVASLYDRYWYHQKESTYRSDALKRWANSRIRADQVGEMSTREWNALSRFGRCCWYWSYTNRLIQTESERLNLRIKRCKLENLIDDLPEIASFLCVDISKKTNIPVSNITTGRGPFIWQYWSKKQRAIFKEIAGSVMDQNYPCWREEMEMQHNEPVKGFFQRQLRLLLEISWPFRDRFGFTHFRRDLITKYLKKRVN